MVKYPNALINPLYNKKNYRKIEHFGVDGTDEDCNSLNWHHLEYFLNE